MLFVVFCTVKAGSTTKSRIARRVPFQYPAGARVLAEYWLLSERPNVVLAVEGESVAALLGAVAEWDDVFEFTIIPAITAEEGIAAAPQLAATTSG